MSEPELCPDCGTPLCEHGVCMNYCHDEACGGCLRKAEEHNYIVAEDMALTRMWNLVGGFTEPSG